MRHQKEWDNRFIQVAKLISTWSTCLKENRHVGAVITKDNRILATGYNGAPSKIETCQNRNSCNKVTSNLKSQECCYAVHAEQNAIAQAAKLGISIEGGTLYCTHSPCAVCAKSIINSGIKRVIFDNFYPDRFALDLLSEAGVTVQSIISILKESSDNQD